MAFILSRILTTTGGSVTIEPVGLFESEEAAKGASGGLREVIGAGLQERMADASPVGRFLQLCGVQSIAFRISKAEVRGQLLAPEPPKLVSVDGSRLGDGKPRGILTLVPR